MSNTISKICHTELTKDDIKYLKQDKSRIQINNNVLFNFGTNVIPQTDLSGHVLVSMPSANYDSLLSNALVYIASHDKNGGAFGFILNSRIGSTSWSDIVKNDNTIFRSSLVDIYSGGIEQQGKGFILHSQDYNHDLLFSSNTSKINVSCNNEIINSIVYENRPNKYLFITGSTTWKKHQLEREVMSNMWMILNPSFAQHFIFSKAKEDSWALAMNAIGINVALYMSRVGSD